MKLNANFDGFFDGACDTILSLQKSDGSIPWFRDGVFDPWNHLEAAMGLNTLGAREAAENAIGFLRNSQLEDGSWWGQLGSAVPIDKDLHQFTMQGVEAGHRLRDTNFIAYCATAIWHHLCLHQDLDYAHANWPPSILSWRCNIQKATFAGPRATRKRRKKTPSSPAIAQFIKA